jgi:DNA-binding NtrC family response regulator
MKQYDVLIVDDEKRFADMLARRLSLRGCTCYVCYSGQEALDIVKRKDFSLILLDLNLPDIYGTEVLKRLKKNPAEIPVIILTGHGTEDDRRECMRYGAYEFMQKPAGIDKLMDIFAEIKGLQI